MSQQSSDTASVLLALRKLLLGTEHHRRSLAKTMGVGTIELAVMGHLHESGELTPKDIGDRLGVTTGSTTAILDRIEQAGYLVRKPNPYDRRSVILSLTPNGELAIAAAIETQAAQLTAALAGTGYENLEGMATALNAVADTVGDPASRNG
ncbi:MarR family winged helix-turn-helix transcriptional regulator [Jatrophihabitans sp. DSM 45814]